MNGKSSVNGVIGKTGKIGVIGVIGLALAAAVLGGCAKGGPDKSASQPGGGNGSGGAPGNLSPEKTLLQFHRTGGFVGVSETLTVTNRGDAALVSDKANPRHFAVSPRQLAELEQALQGCKFTQYTAFPGPGAVVDGFAYGIDYEGHTVTFADGGPPLPPDLSRVVRCVSAILREAASRPIATAPGAPGTGSR